jgi:hypothetical protein
MVSIPDGIVIGIARVTVQGLIAQVILVDDDV